MKIRILAIVATALVLSGCWPAKFTYRTGIEGTVVSSDDGSPVTGASIRITVPREDLVPALSIVTTLEGRFEVPPHYKWGMKSVFGESWPVQGTVEIVASGFVPFVKELEWPQTGPETEDFGVVRLVKSH